MDLTTCAVYLVSFIIAYFSLNAYKKFFGNKNSIRNLPPCLPRLPIVGSLPFISDRKKIYIYFMRKSKVLGNVIAFYSGHQYYIVLNGRKTIYEAFVKNSIKFASRPVFFLTRIAEHPYDDEFKIYHRACLNVFKKFGLGDGVMEMRIKSEIEHFVQMIKLKKGQPFNPSPEVTLTIFNVVGSILYGKRWSITDPEFLTFKEFAETLASGYILNIFPGLRFLPHFKRRIKLFVAALEKWKQFLDKNIRSILHDKSKETFYNQFNEELKIMAHNLQIGGEDFKAIAKDFTLAGTETSAITMLWFIYYIANHQDVQKQMRDELDRVVGSNRLPSYEDKFNLPITEACLLEVMRIRTLVPLTAPHLTLKESVIDGVYIPSGVVVLANLYSVHMDPDVWDEPEKFKIERFLSDDKRKVANQDQIIPFSLGRRSCTGEPLARQELFLFASTLVQQFQILPPEGKSEIAVEEIVGITVSPTPFNVRFIERV